MGVTQPINHAHTVKVKYEMNSQPSRDELEEIIRNWEEEDKEEAWDNVGFQLSGEQTTHWLSHAFARSALELNVVRENAEVVQARSLLAVLREQRAVLLRTIS